VEAIAVVPATVTAAAATAAAAVAAEQQQRRFKLDFVTICSLHCCRVCFLT